MKKNTNMLLRVLTAVIFIPVIVIIIYILPDIVTAIALGIISAIAIYEALVSTDFLKHSRVAAWSMLFAGLIPIWSYLGIHYLHALAGMYIYVVILFCETIASKNTLGLERLGGAFFLTLFIPLALSAFVRMRFLDHWRFYVILPFVIAFLSDAFAYFTGMAFGRHKLAPDLSPKKTVEGAVGGLVGATVSAMVAGFIYHFGAPEVTVNYAALALYGLLGSLASQLGDLSFSCIKREYGIKDFGNILPGHGGILDRFDSVIFCAPLVELLLYILPVVK